MKTDLGATVYSYLRPILAVVLTLVALLSLGWFLLHQGMQMQNRWLLVSVGVCLFVGLALVGVNTRVVAPHERVQRDLTDQRKLLESILNGCFRMRWSSRTLAGKSSSAIPPP